MRTRTTPNPGPRLDRPRRATRASARPGFTLIELLTVIFIIGLLIAIILPALSNVQGSGRQAATQSLLIELNNAAASFELDNRRQPGYYTQDELASLLNFDPSSPDNGQGITALENAMLELSGAGAVRTVGPGDDPDLWDGDSEENWVIINPTDNSDRQIWVKADLIGSDEGNYFIPSENALVHMDGRQQQSAINVDQPQNQGLPRGLPDLVDADGTPILAWIDNDKGPRNIRGMADFASVNPAAAVAQGARASRFYWATNGSMLSSFELGEIGRDMTPAPANDVDGSLIGLGAAQDLDPEQMSGILNALLGHPGYPAEAELAEGNYEMIYPKQARGGFVAHAAGPDGMFLGTDDRRFGRMFSTDMFGGGSVNITYGVNFFAGVDSSDAPRRRGDDKQPVTRDFIEGFDDIVVAQ